MNCHLNFICCLRYSMMYITLEKYCSLRLITINILNSKCGPKVDNKINEGQIKRRKFEL